MPGVLDDPDDAGPVGAHAGGERWTLGSEAHDVLARVQHAHRPVRARRPAAGRPPPTSLDRLPPNAPPLASGVTGSPPGAHHEASGSRYAGSTQVVWRVRSQVPSGSVDGPGQRRGRPAALDLAGPAAGLGRASRRRPSRRRPSARRPARPPGAMSSANPPPPERDVRPDLLGSSPPRARRGRGRRFCPPGSAADRSLPEDRTASTMEFQPVQRHRWAARARWTAGADRRAAGSRAATRMMMPGVQKPHCDGAVGGEAVRPRPRRRAARRAS